MRISEILCEALDRNTVAAAVDDIIQDMKNRGETPLPDKNRLVNDLLQFANKNQINDIGSLIRNWEKRSQTQDKPKPSKSAPPPQPTEPKKFKKSEKPKTDKTAKTPKEIDSNILKSADRAYQELLGKYNIPDVLDFINKYREKPTK